MPCCIKQHVRQETLRLDALEIRIPNIVCASEFADEGHGLVDIQEAGRP